MFRQKKIELELAKQRTIQLQEESQRNAYKTKTNELNLLIQKQEVLYNEQEKKLLKSFALKESIRQNEFLEQKQQLDLEYKQLLSELKSKIDYYDKIIRDFDKIIQQKCEYYPQLSVIMSDLLTVYMEQSAKFLCTKPRPAFTEAKRIMQIKRAVKPIIAKCKNLEYQLAYIKLLFPNIMDIFDVGFEEDNFELETEDTTDKTRFYLLEEEYKKLSEIDRNQLALNRYIEGRKKSKWQIGRDYEMYIGYLFEQQGFNVTYTGIIKNLEDMGRDLIAIKNLDTYISQCKYWAQHKEIHEKHIFQLFGTVTLYKIEHPFENVRGVFITPNNLSKVAKDVAKALDILVFNEELGNFPRIKCNINRTTKDKIYHLPFDQQYDNTIIEKDNGEFLAYTVEEAHNKGFRRAIKHYIK